MGQYIFLKHQVVVFFVFLTFASAVELDLHLLIHVFRQVQDVLLLWPLALALLVVVLATVVVIAASAASTATVTSAASSVVAPVAAAAASASVWPVGHDL